MNKIILGLVLINSLSFAGQGGNGGDAVVCRDADNEIISARLLDYYEGEQRRIPMMINESQDLRQYLLKITQRLQSMSSFFAKHPVQNEALRVYDAIQEYMNSKAEWIENIHFTVDDMVDIPDSAHLTFASGCKVEQFVIRVEKAFSEDPDYIIREDVLPFLSPSDLVGISLHESISKSLYENTYIVHTRLNEGSTWEPALKDSKLARYFVQKMGTNATAEEFSFFDYIEMSSQTQVLNEKNDLIKLPANTFVGNNGATLSIVRYLDDNVALVEDHRGLVYAIDEAGNFLSDATLEHGGVYLAFEYIKKKSSTPSGVVLERRIINSSESCSSFHGRQLSQRSYLLGYGKHLVKKHNDDLSVEKKSLLKLSRLYGCRFKENLEIKLDKLRAGEEKTYLQLDIQLVDNKLSISTSN